MKYTLISIIFFILILIPSFTVAAEDLIFIEGITEIPEHWEFFDENFRIEAGGLGFTVVDDKADSEYTFKFEVEPSEYDDFIIITSLVSNEDDTELVSLSRFFEELEEAYDFTQFMFFQTVILIPRSSVVETITETIVITIEDNDDWRNKWLYIRASINYPISFYLLKSTGNSILFGGTAVYHGDITDPDRYAPIDNRITALPGATAGLELQFLRWMSIEPNFQVMFGEEGHFLSMAAGLELKFPIKLIRNFMLEPYAAASMPLNTSDAFTRYPPLAVGAGFQFAMKGGNSGAFFIDLNYMMSLTDAVLRNPYGADYPKPERIRFQRSVIGIGVGYKYGFFNRRR